MGWTSAIARVLDLIGPRKAPTPTPTPTPVVPDDGCRYVSPLGEAAYRRANLAAVAMAVGGAGPDKPSADLRAGARMVFNIPSVHVPAFCNAPPGTRAYKNCYDLQIANAHLGDAAPKWISQTRDKVDRALPISCLPSNVYFAAVELNGCGVRFYGDLCLVLKPTDNDAHTVILDRNSYDVTRPPFGDLIAAMPETNQHNARCFQLAAWSGSWADDLARIAGEKVERSLPAGTRRWTTGQMSEALLDDEDYIEVLKVGSFRADALQEARWSAADAGQDALVGDRLHAGPVPDIATLLWRCRRQRAERALRLAGVPVRVVTTSGRLKG